MARQLGQAVCAVWCVLGSLLGVWAGPVLILEPATVDWGRQAENKGEYAFTFTVKNAGDEALQITRVRPGCSCTKVELRKDTLAPGESTEMTGTLATKDIEGAMQKGIILTSNDPLHQTTVASLAIRFPINCQGLRLKGGAVAARLRQGALWGYVVVENCEPETAARIEAMELPQGWECQQPLPIAVPPEDRVSLVLTRAVGEGVEPDGFEGLAFVLVTDSAKTGRLEGSLVYRPDVRATPVAAPTGGTAGATARWPMAKPEPVGPRPVRAPAADSADGTPGGAAGPSPATSGGAAP